MTEYLLSVIGTVLLCSVITAIVPEGKTTSVVKGVAKLACVLAIVSPVLQFFKTGNDFGLTDKNSQVFFEQSVIQTDEDFIQYYSEMRIRMTEQALANELSDLYAVVANVTLEWSLEKEAFANAYEAEAIRISKMCVDVPETLDEEVKGRMWEYLTKNYCSEVLIE